MSKNILNAMFLTGDAGTENAYLNYAETLKSLGYNVINLVHPEAEIIKKLKQRKLKFETSKFLGRFGKNDIFTILYFKKLVSLHNIDIVFAHQGKLIKLFKKAKKEAKLIAVNHGHNPKHSVGCDHAITINSSTKKQTEILGQDKEKISILPNCIELNKEDKEGSRKLNKTNFVIGSYGRFSSEKGYETLIDALNHLNKEEDLKFKVILGGKGEQLNLLKEKTKNYNLEDRIEFSGWVKDKTSFFKEIDLFVVPSREEEFGLTMVEAMKYHTPVLATSCPGPSDVIKDGYNGYLVDINNPYKMASKLAQIIQNPSHLKTISKNAYQILKDKYCQDSFKEKLNQILVNL